MKKVHKLFYSLITFVLICLAVSFMNSLVSPSEMDTAVKAASVFHELPKDSVDVLCFGSSHMWYGLDPTVINREQNFSAYNFGCYYQKINTTLLFMQDAFRTQHPKVVIVDTFYANRLKTDNIFDGELYSTKNIRFSDDKLNYLKSLFGKDTDSYISYFFPFSVFHGNWNTVSFHEKNSEDSFDLRSSCGYAAFKTVVPSSFADFPSAEQRHLSTEAEAVLTKMVQLCRENNAELIFITIPYEEEYHYSEAMMDFARRNGCTYIDLFAHIQDMNLNAKTDFADRSHLNTSGAAKVASFMGNYIADHYNFS